MSKIEVNEIDTQTGTTITVGSACKSVAVPGNVVKTNAVQASDGGNIVSQCGTTNTIGAGGDTTNVPGAAVVTGNITGANLISSGNVVKSNAYQASDGGNIVSQSGTAITIGASGDTVSLASGASQSGFGRSGSVDWETTAKTGDFTATSGEGYFINTTSGEIIMTLPAGSAGAIVAAQDYNNTFDSNKFTVLAAGSNKINGGTAGGKIDLTTEGEGITLVYVDDTVGWRSIEQSVFTDQSAPTAAYVTASGGTVSTVGDYKIHTFTGPGTFTVSCAGNACGSNTVDYLVLAGGGAGGGGGPGTTTGAGGGGAGGFRESPGTASGSYSVSPLAGGSALSVPATAYPIVVGGGGSGAPGGGKGGNGSNSSFSSITSTGGGAGGGHSPQCGSNGGSGGAGSPVGSGNSPPVSPPQGQPGSSNGPRNLSGGGGATQAGIANPPSSNSGVASGGTGATSSISNSPTVYAGGGGGGGAQATGYFGLGGSGIGGNGGVDGGSNPGNSAAPANRGSGGGGGSDSGPTTGGSGSSGIVIIRYKFQN